MELSLLESSLGTPGQAAAISQRQALYGLGGIGKTRLAVEYAWRHGSRYTAVFFLRADSEASLRASLAELTRRPYLNLPENDVRQEDIQAGAALAWLREHPGWLLILDNVDSDEAARAALNLLPGLSAGRVLLTTRRIEWPPGVRKQPLDTLSLDESVAFLLERTEDDRIQAGDDETQARRLAELLDGLPLALEQAGAYIAHNRLSFAGYLADWEREREKVLAWYDETTMQYPRSLATTWQASYEHLSPLAQVVLILCSYLAPEPIPVAMLEGSEPLVRSAVGLLPGSQAGDGDARSSSDAVAELAAHSMIVRQADSFALHPIVQEVMRTGAGRERARDWIEAAAWLVEAHVPTEDAGDIRTWPVWNLLRPHAEAVVAWADGEGIENPTNLLQSDLGAFFLGKGLYVEAERYFRRAFAVCEASSSVEVRARLPLCLNNLAQLLKETDRLAEAEPLMRNALELDREALGEYHPTVARDLNNLAGLLQATNRLAEAEPLIRQALDIDRKAFGDDHPRIAIRLNNLAQLLLATNRLAEAEPLMRQAFDIDRQAFGDDHPNVATDLNNLAHLLQASNRLAEAEPLMRRSLDIDRRAFSDDHPRIAIRLNNLAQLLLGTNRLTEAEPLMRQALDIDGKAFGDEHPRVAGDLGDLAQLLDASGRLTEAQRLARRSVEIFEAVYGPDHPHTQIARKNLTAILANLSSSQPRADQ